LAVSFARSLEAKPLEALGRLANLERLHLKKASQPTDAEWASFFMNQRAAAMESRQPALADGRRQWCSLSFAECELFADGAAAGVSGFSQPMLTFVDLSWCWLLTDDGVRGIISAAPMLQRLKLAGLKRLTAFGLVLCSGLPRLEELDVTSCNSVSDGILEFLHRLFSAPSGHCEEGLPASELPPNVARVAEALWSQRVRTAPKLQVKNYYGEYFQGWQRLKPALETCAEAEALLENCRPLSP